MRPFRISEKTKENVKKTLFGERKVMFFLGGSKDNQTGNTILTFCLIKPMIFYLHFLQNPTKSSKNGKALPTQGFRRAFSRSRETL